MCLILPQRTRLLVIDLEQELVEAVLDLSGVLLEPHDRQKSLSTNLADEIGTTLGVSLDQAEELVHALFS